jgi:hypothetical protein
MRAFIAATLSVLACAALAAEEPDAAYAQYHRAAVSGDLDGVARYSQAAQRNEIAAMSRAQRDANVKMLRASMPRGFVLRSKTVARDGRTAHLVVSGPSEPVAGEKPETLYGSIRMVLEGGEWKVAESDWNNTPPPGPQGAPNSAPAAPAAAGARPAAQKAAIPARSGGGAVVGSTSSGPEHKLGTAKEPCVYKPVMTAEDMERCR